MDQLDTLLKLIEEGNEEKILAEKDLIKAFNKLCKYNLVEIREEGIFLTPDGKKARLEGAAKVIRENEKNTNDFSQGKIEKEKTSLKVILALLILLFLFFFIITF